MDNSQNNIKIYYCDGGFSRSRNPTYPAYGSYRGVLTKIEDKKEDIITLDEQQWFEYKNNISTNNQAEFATFINLLTFLRDTWDKEEVLIRMDSRVVIDSVNGLSNIKEDGLKILCQQAKIIMQSCKFRVLIVWIPGDLMKVILGH